MVIGESKQFDGECMTCLTPICPQCGYCHRCDENIDGSGTHCERCGSCEVAELRDHATDDTPIIVCECRNCGDQWQFRLTEASGKRHRNHKEDEQ